jgi:hypothetical protein
VSTTWICHVSMGACLRASICSERQVEIALAR